MSQGKALWTEESPREPGRIPVESREGPGNSVSHTPHPPRGRRNVSSRVWAESGSPRRVISGRRRSGRSQVCKQESSHWVSEDPPELQEDLGQAGRQGVGAETCTQPQEGRALRHRPSTSIKGPPDPHPCRHPSSSVVLP